MSQSYTDQQIIDAFRAGGLHRDQAWEFAFKDWHSRIIGVIVQRGGTRDEAMEALQEAFPAFDRRVRQLDFVLQHRLATYFVHCVSRQWARKKKGRKMDTVELEESRQLTDFVNSVEEELAQTDLARLVDTTLARLGERCREILRHFMNGFNMQEIAGKMGFSNEQVARNEKLKCQDRYEAYLRTHPDVLQHIQNQRNG